MAGRGRGRGEQLKGAAWEYDPEVKLDFNPSETFPPYKIPIAAPITEKERRQVKYYKELREQIHQGPLYTQPSKRDPHAPAKTYSEDQFNDRYGVQTKADIDPFTGVPTYSVKYEQKKRVIPQLSGRPFNKALFPKELWSTLEGEEGEQVRSHLNRSMQKKSLILAGDPATRQKLLEDKIKALTQTAEDDEDGEAEEEHVEEDYDYEEDEIEMGGDYDGEQYFDGGEDDEEVDAGDGGGGDGDY